MVRGGPAAAAGETWTPVRTTATAMAAAPRPAILRTYTLDSLRRQQIVNIYRPRLIATRFRYFYVSSRNFGVTTRIGAERRRHGLIDAGQLPASRSPFAPPVYEVTQLGPCFPDRRSRTDAVAMPFRRLAATRRWLSLKEKTACWIACPGEGCHFSGRP